MLTDNWPRVALSLNAVVNRSNNSQSCVGASFSASKAFWSPVQYCHVFKPFCPVVPLAHARMLVDLRNTDCHGVPRWTRPIQPTVASLFAGKSQLSEPATSGSL